MPHINLLPWREELRRERQRLFINVAVGAAILMIGIVALTHIQIDGMINAQNARNSFLQEQITRKGKAGPAGAHEDHPGAAGQPL